MDNCKTDIGQKIKYFRKKRGMTQEELAEKVDLSEKHISKIETGIHQPSIIAFFKIVKVLNIGIEEFGLSLKTESNTIKEEIMSIINNSTDYELEFMLPIIKTLQNNLRKR